MNDDAPAAHCRPRTDRHARKARGAHAEERALPQRHAAGQMTAGGDVHEIPQPPVVVDRRARVDDGMRAHRDVGLEHGAREHDRPGPEADALVDHGRRVHDGGPPGLRVRRRQPLADRVGADRQDGLARVFRQPRRGTDDGHAEHRRPLRLGPIVEAAGDRAARGLERRDHDLRVPAGTDDEDAHDSELPVNSGIVACDSAEMPSRRTTCSTVRSRIRRSRPSETRSTYDMS